jgi:hypothetical protein
VKTIEQKQGKKHRAERIKQKAIEANEIAGTLVGDPLRYSLQ